MTRIRTLVAVAALALVAAACGDDTTDEATPADDVTTTAAPSDDDMTDDDMTDDDMTDDDMTDDDMTDDDMMEVTTFVVTIENTSGGAGLATPLAPGVWAATDGSAVLFTDGEVDPGDGLEALAEDGDPAALATHLEMADGVFHSGVFTTPTDATEPGPAGPGSAYRFEVPAAPGEYLTFATMFVQSNDWFFAPDTPGIALFDADGQPVSGEFTTEVILWDAGTEVDETPGEGPNQAPRQAGPDTGDDQDAPVAAVDEPTSIRLTIEPAT